MDGAYRFLSDDEEREELYESTPQGAVTEREDQEDVEETRWDYVFFDWKGTLARKSGMDYEQRTHTRLSHFYAQLRSLLGTEDRDGTPTFEAVHDAYRQAKHEVEQFKGKNFSWRDVLDVLLLKLGLQRMSETDKNLLVTSFQVGGDHDAGVYHGANEVLRWLKHEKNVRLGLIRNSKVTEEAMRHRIKKAGIDDSVFDTIVMGGEIGFAKPDAEVFISAAEAARVRHVHDRNPERILYVGNEVEADVVGAKNVGWSSVLVTHTENTSNGLADFDIDNLAQLKSIFGTSPHRK